MEERVAIIGIIVENLESVPELNKLLSEYGDNIIGRMGIPYHKKNVNIISIAIDAKIELIEELNKKIRDLDGIYTEIAYNRL